MLIALVTHSQTRKNFYIPDLNGYRILKCDLHIHTTFSDGVVWPTERVEEAWNDGLDAIAITDHLEYTPHSNYLKVDHNAGYDIAKGIAAQKDILLIHGTEITKKMPGHFNALFIKDATKIANDDYKKAIEEANKQGAFVILNHPREAVPNGGEWWYKELDELFRENLFQGIEIFNWNDYYPRAFDWALNKNMTIFSATDIHNESALYLSQLHMARRPMTLVFARERSIDGIKEALIAGRTVGFFRNVIYGKEELVKELFLKSIQIGKIHHDISRNASVSISNTSDIPYILNPMNQDKSSASIQLGAKESAIFALPSDSTSILEYEVENVMIRSNEKLKIKLTFIKD
ncbi:hypothetical protein AQPE_0463 [Aquipluma nitroreducens]|uniref:Polymerase/histidinol phosphatase N-terminal domain-containing protein n=2 Tax=Aquipluma nitroreducens TaxID=2010828 RepID=A0A5K7S480_9BACT|nr:hypothetical protein AQPE_0463 [Aquipluma nitroreducens]